VKETDLEKTIAEEIVRIRLDLQYGENIPDQGNIRYSYWYGEGVLASKAEEMVRIRLDYSWLRK
jgi:hypothetical protein